MNNALLDSRQYLTFGLGKESFGLGIAQVKEIIDYRDITVLPRMTDFFKGVIDLRGLVLPIIDLGVLLNMGITEKTDETCIVIGELAVGEKFLTVGVMVDEVQEVVQLEDENISPPTKVGSGIKTEFVKGIADHADGFLMILDLNRVFSGDEIAIIEKVAEDNVAN